MVVSYVNVMSIISVYQFLEVEFQCHHLLTSRICYIIEMKDCGNPELEVSTYLGLVICLQSVIKTRIRASLIVMYPVERISIIKIK